MIFQKYLANKDLQLFDFTDILAIKWSLIEAKTKVTEDFGLIYTINKLKKRLYELSSMSE